MSETEIGLSRGEIDLIYVIYRAVFVLAVSHTWLQRRTTEFLPFVFAEMIQDQ